MGEGEEGGEGEQEDQCSLLVFQLLVVKLSDLDDRRRAAERRPTPTGRGSHRLDLTPAAGEREVTAEEIHSVFDSFTST